LQDQKLSFGKGRERPVDQHDEIHGILGSGTASEKCSAITTTGSWHMDTTLLPSMATVPSWSPSGSLKSYVHCPGSGAGSEWTPKNSSLVTPGYAPAIYNASWARLKKGETPWSSDHSHKLQPAAMQKMFPYLYNPRRIIILIQLFQGQETGIFSVQTPCRHAGSRGQGRQSSCRG
jgi:hypothetical protein